MVAVSVICAETDAQAQWLAGPRSWVSSACARDRPGRLPTPEEAAATSTQPRNGPFWKPGPPGRSGDPDTVEAGLETLIAETGTDELMITAMIHGYEDRVRSYELVPPSAAGRPVPPPGATHHLAAPVEPGIVEVAPWLHTVGKAPFLVTSSYLSMSRTLPVRRCVWSESRWRCSSASSNGENR